MLHHELVGLGRGIGVQAMPEDEARTIGRALRQRVQVRNFEERSTKASEEAGEAQACAFMEWATVGSDQVERFGVGLDTNIVTASIKALVSGVNRLGVSVQAPHPS